MLFESGLSACYSLTRCVSAKIRAIENSKVLRKAALRSAEKAESAETGQIFSLCRFFFNPANA